MKWESWDPDVKVLSNVSGPCENGTTCLFEMKDGSNLLATLSNVKENESVVFSGGMYGLLSFKGSIDMKEAEGGGTDITYEFTLSGPVGYAIGWLKKSYVENGTRDGLANIVKNAEAAMQ